MLPTRLSTLAVAFVAAVLCLTVSAGPALEMEVARGVTLDRRVSAAESALYGTRSVLLRGAVTLFSAAGNHKAAVYKKTTVFVPCQEHLSKSSINALQEAPINGMLVGLCDGDTKNEELLSLFLSSSAVPFPVYFIEPSNATATEALLRAHGTHTATEYVVISAGKSLRLAPAYVNETFPAYQVYSALTVKPKEGSAADIPRVLLTANFDTFGVAPSARTTAGASGTAAAMELYRRESATAAAGSENGFALAMLLGSTARFNYAATTQWLQSRKDAEMDRYKLIVSLDDLLPSSSSSSAAAGEESGVLYMHVQDTFMRRPDGKELTELAQKVAAAHGVELKVQPARTDYQHYDLRFEHEVFANRQLPAATFSTHRAPVMDQLFRASVREVVNKKTVAVLAKRVAFLEAYLNALLGTDAANAEGAGAKQWPGSESYLAGIIRGASRTVRSPLAQHGAPLRAYAETLEQHLRQVDATTRAAAAGVTTGVLPVTSMQTTVVKPAGLAVYGPYEETLRLFVAKSAMTEGALALVVVAVLAIFGVLEFGVGGLKRVVLGA